MFIGFVAVFVSPFAWVFGHVVDTSLFHFRLFLFLLYYALDSAVSG